MTRLFRNTTALALAFALATACAAPGDRTATTQSSTAGGDKVEQVPACGDRIDALSSRIDGLSMTGEFPPRATRDGDGTFAGAVTVTSTGAEIAGVATPEADVYVAKAGEVVAVPLPKDSLGQAVNLRSGVSQVFTARGTVRQCSGGGPLPQGKYEVFAAIVVNRDDGPPVVVTGGPWPLEVS
ncbi:hypothetical protein ACFWN2_02500 [Lentzea sp. NPDC058436]|uniref:hypothetical protein n=1 Tax=Lentzea sp. NPDC058436 TaxID=3346499 RepID=UPI003655DAE2